MRREHFIVCLFSILIIVVGVTQALAVTTSPTTVELTTPLHFLTPAGDDIEVGPGIYEVEAVESWLKLVPEGEGPASAVLLGANLGSHEKILTESIVRAGEDSDNADVFHIALLMPKGMGLEAVGTTTGIRQRGLSLAFVTRPNKAQMQVSRFGTSTVGSGSQTQAPSTGSQGRPVDCGPYMKLIDTHQYNRNPAIAVFKDKLHVVYAFKDGDHHRFRHEIFDGKEWGDMLPGKDNADGGIGSILAKKGTHAALVVFQDRLHMVYSSGFDKRLAHTYFDGKKWSRIEGIIGQKSKATPALVVFRNQLHMVHLGDTSFDIWYSVYKEKGWTINQKIGIKSGGTPALAVFGNRIHMVTTRLPKPQWDTTPNYLYQWEFDGDRWSSPVKLPGQFSKATPALVTYGARLHMVHLGNLSNNLWYSSYGWHQTQGTKGKYAWFGVEKLSGLKSDSLVDVVFHEGCLHMASRVGSGDYQDRQEIRYTIFSPRLK